MADNKLVMETNAGSKIIQEKGSIPGYGDVWYDADAVSNLFSLSDMVKRGMRVVYDSQKGNEFIVWTKDQRKIKFPVDERGLYVKEKYKELQERLSEEEEEDSDSDDDEPPTLMRVDLDDSDDESMDDDEAPALSLNAHLDKKEKDEGVINF